ncbi:MAG TPA: TauD/TfdA family dioxygenase [Blastocatellia bacterium]|jgi:alpha-ketoglutarate-dependent taurine dioxygenase
MRKDAAEIDIAKFKSFKRAPIRLSQESLVKTGYFCRDRQFPLVMTPNVQGLDLITWAANNSELIEGKLLRHGAIVFRDFSVDSITKFEQFAQAISPDLMQYGERSSPRSKISGGVYTSTDHPPDQQILLHNEQSYTLNWPMKIWFYCLQPAEEGGSTPIADVRRIYRMLNPVIIEKFGRLQIMYVRNYGDGLGLPWEEVFQTEDKAAVEKHCRDRNIKYEWKEGNRLRTRQVRPAIRRHPRTGDNLWFNHAIFFHLSSLDQKARESMLSVIREEDVPYNTFYGDGSSIEPEFLDEIREAYRSETVSFPWKRGDILMLDNMLTAHGRESFTGSRRILVAMAEPFNTNANA